MGIRAFALRDDKTRGSPAASKETACPSETGHLVERAGFTRRQGGGSHVFFFKPGVEEILNLQPIGNKAKAYQVKQVRNLLLKHLPEID